MGAPSCSVGPPQSHPHPRTGVSGSSLSLNGSPPSPWDRSPSSASPVWVLLVPTLQDGPPKSPSLGQAPPAPPIPKRVIPPAGPHAWSRFFPLVPISGVGSPVPPSLGQCPASPQYPLATRLPVPGAPLTCFPPRSTPDAVSPPRCTGWGRCWVRCWPGSPTSSSLPPVPPGRSWAPASPAGTWRWWRPPARPPPHPPPAAPRPPQPSGTRAQPEPPGPPAPVGGGMWAPTPGPRQLPSPAPSIGHTGHSAPPSGWGDWGGVCAQMAPDPPPHDRPLPLGGLKVVLGRSWVQSVAVGDVGGVSVAARPPRPAPSGHGDTPTPGSSPCPCPLPGSPGRVPPPSGPVARVGAGTPRPPVPCRGAERSKALCRGLCSPGRFLRAPMAVPGPNPPPGRGISAR